MSIFSILSGILSEIFIEIGYF